MFVNLYNTPENINYNFIVARLDDNKLWYWGSYETEEKADEIAQELIDAIVVTKE